MAWCLEEGFAYLARKDKRMAAAIAEIGGMHRSGGDDLFTALVQSIIGQQISLRAADTVWRRLVEALGAVNPRTLSAASAEQLRACGMSQRKAEYLLGAANAVQSGQIDLDALQTAEDETIIRTLTQLKGVGRWTVEMLLIFSLERQDVMSYDDFGLRAGLCRLYHHQTMPRARFARYAKRFSPYGTAASLVLWEIAGGRTPNACAAPLREKPNAAREAPPPPPDENARP